MYWSYPSQLTYRYKAKLPWDWQVAPVRVYRVQYKDNLTDPVWLDLPGSIVVVGNQAQTTTSATTSARYYRVIAN